VSSGREGSAASRRPRADLFASEAPDSLHQAVPGLSFEKLLTEAATASAPA
jgi:hypothetical protein